MKNRGDGGSITGEVTGNLRVLLIPHYEGNPYSRLLASSLEEANVDVRPAGASSAWLSLLGAARARGPVDLVHLQWQHRFFFWKDEGTVRAGFRTALFFVQWLVLRLLGIRFVWTVHNIVDHERRHVRLELRACRLLARLVDGIIVHCDVAADRVREAYRVGDEKIHVVPHGHYIGSYPAPPDPARAREELGLPQGRRVLLHFGQIRPYKGVEDLIRAFRALGDPSGEDWRLVIAGQPRYEWLGDRIRSLAKGDSRIRLDLRYVPDEELVSYLSAADGVVLPYTNLLTSGSAVLAASYGRVVVAPAVGCLREFPAAAIIRYPADQDRGLEKALRETRDAPLAEMGRAAREFIEGFPWVDVGRRTAGIYRRCSPARSEPGSEVLQ